MTSTTVLLRSIARICGAEAAVASIDDDFAVYGMPAAAALDAVACVRADRPPPNGRLLIRALPIPLAVAGRRGTLYLFDRCEKAIDPAYVEVLRVIAAEIGREIDGQPVSQRNQMSSTFGPVLAQVAGGIDSLNDAAAILEWPRIGSEPRFVYVNLAFEETFGYGAATAIGRMPDMLHGPLTNLDLVEIFHDRVRATREARGSIVYYRSDGVPIWVDVSMRSVCDNVDGEACVVSTMRDITTRKEFELAIGKEKRKLQVTLAAIGDGVITTVADGRVDFVNDAARLIFSIDAAETYGEPIAQALHLTSSDGDVIDVLAAGDDGAGVRRGQARFERGSTVKHIAFVTSPIADEGFVVVLRDVTAQHRLATQLSYEASHDSLTNIYNRRKFDEVLDDAIHAARCGEGPHALAFLDLDRFKLINDSCGHEVGDRLLVDLAHLLQQQLRGRDVLARIGGDEFAVLLHECSLQNARRVLDKLRLAVESHQVSFGGRAYNVGVSIGIAPIDGNETDSGAIFRRADHACYVAKGAGRNAIAG